MTPEQEIKLLKELLYCTKRSCNNCGKVNCENFQRQRIDCCGLWVSYKDYITDLENKIADIKANCDLAIEGRDIKIKELEFELTVEKDQLQEETNLHLHAENYIKSLEEELTKKADTNHSLVEQMADLGSKNAELKTDKQYWEQKANRLTTEWGETLDQLAQAKEIIKEFVCHYNNKTIYVNNVKPLLEQAEQFLKGV